MAMRRVFHHGRLSVTSYATLSVVLIDSIALELLHKVNRNAMVRMPPVLLPDSLAISSAMIRTTSGGAT